MSTLVEEPPKPLTEAEPIPPSVTKKMERGRAQMRKQGPWRRLCYKFWRGESYWFVNKKNLLVNQSTLSVLLGGDKVSHRIRNRYPFIAMIVAAKVSQATQRVPSYEIVPSKTDPQAEQAAELGEKVALWGYDEWRLRRVTTKAFTHAFVGGEGFVYPYFDNTVGPYMTDDSGETTAEGEVAHKVLSGNEVYWEPGVDFDESRWHVVEQARPLDLVKEMPGFLGGELKADATDSDAPSDADKANLVLVSEYLERPSAKRPNGRRIVMANQRRIIPDEDYPCQDHEGNVLDEPVLVRISYTVEVDDRDRSLVDLLIDPQRTIQDCWNKLLEWKNRCLNPQMIAPRGSDMSRRDDSIGATWYYNPVGGQAPKWETPPAVPRELFMMLDKAIEHMRALSADVDVQPDPRLTTGTAQASIEQAQLRWQSFLGDAAEFHSRVMRRDLYLVQRHYTEARLVKIQGTFGPDLTPGFLGADLLGEADVRVSPSSLEVKSRKSIIDETLLFADRGWISPQAAMATIQGGVAENLWRGWALDVGQANKIIQTIKRGPEALFAIPDRPPLPGEEANVGQNGLVPGFMPRPFDKVEVIREVFESWMKTADWDMLGDDMKFAAGIYYAALINLQQQKEAQAQVQQFQIAQGRGMANASRPVPPPQHPSIPGVPNGQAQ